MSLKPKSKKAERASRGSAGHVLPKFASKERIESGAKGAKHILVVDDDPALARVLALKFSNSGFDVTVCHDGAQAIAAMDQQKFSGIILDLIMPEKSGFDVLMQRPNTKNKTTPVFVMTDMRTQETEQQVKSLGASGYFIKMQIPLKEVIDIITQAT